MTQDPQDRIDQDKQRSMMKEAQVMPTMRPALHSGKKKYCYCCGKEGHLSPDCPKKDEIPRNE